MRAADNPFRTDRVLQVRYQFVNDDGWPEVRRRLEKLDHRAAIVGPRGSGKTTLQEDLASRLQSEGRIVHWLRFRVENKATASDRIKALLAVAASTDLLFVDGAEQLGPLTWARLRRRSRALAGLIITTHAPGRLPTLLSCMTSPALLQNLVGKLIPPDDVDSELLDDLYCRHDGNLRLCLRSLYDHWACRAADGSTPLDTGVPSGTMD